MSAFFFERERKSFDEGLITSEASEEVHKSLGNLNTRVPLLILLLPDANIERESAIIFRQMY